MRVSILATVVAAVFGPVAVLAQGGGDGGQAPSPPASRLRVRLNPNNIRPLTEPDFELWTVQRDVKSVSKTFNGIGFEISAVNSTLDGNQHKFVFTRAVTPLGERVVGEGISGHRDDAGNKPLLMIITGLEEGTHTLHTWHNAWDKLQEVPTLTVSVNGETVEEEVKQSIRVDNIWEAASTYITFSVSGPGDKTEILFAPSGADGRAYLNGFELDSPERKNIVTFPEPPNGNERVLLNGSSSYEFSWHAAQADSARYNVYLGSSPDDLRLVSSNQEETSVVFSGLDTFSTYYWRVDVVAGDETFIGHRYLFRAAQLAFPGAEGYGRWARGGRGGRVIHVTTLEDGEQEGTLRYALSIARGPRYVVFDVGGVITTTSRMTVTDQYVTLAGQTAPGKGIIVQGHPLGLSGAIDTIFRHFKIRPGTISGQTIDASGMAGSNHCIFDRCSLGWGIDENFSSRSAQNITFQRSMISEPLNVAGHKNYPVGTAHGYAATVSGDIGSLHHNLIAHAEGRSWSMGGGTDANGEFAGRLDIRNNVVYNFGKRVTDGGAHEVNFVGNLYKQGPASTLTYALRAQFEDGLPGKQQYYVEGNSMPGVFDQDSVQWAEPDGEGQKKNIAAYADVTINPPPAYRKFHDKPFFPSYVETQTSTEAYKRVLSDSGVSQPVVDDHDKRIVNETLTGTALYKGSVTGKPGLIDNPADAGGLESFPTVRRSASWDADGDGIADWWDGSTGGEGYEPIEGYLNFMADPHAFVEPSGRVKIELVDLFRGYEKKPRFTVEGAEKGSVTLCGTKAVYAAGDEAGIDRISITVEDAEGSKWTREVGIAIFEGASEV